MTARERWNKWYSKNKEKEAKRIKLYNTKNRSKYLTNKKACYIRNKATWVRYAQVNAEKIRNYHKIWTRNQVANNMEFRILKNLRSRLNIALKGSSKSAGMIKLVGCSIIQLKKFIENKFIVGMSWDNYGKWHIDHIKPCAKFDLTKLAEQLACFHYSNLQPLWALDNIIKGDK